MPGQKRCKEPTPPSDHWSGLPPALFNTAAVPARWPRKVERFLLVCVFNHPD